MENTAIVLKTFFPIEHKVLVLDKKLGKLFLVYKKNDIARLCNGAIFEYNIAHDKSKNIISECDIIKFPLVGEDILFFHHILELYNFFIPIGYTYCELFDLLYSLYSLLEQKELAVKDKKIFLYQFFVLLGICPLGLKDEKFLQEWINTCINSHPNANLLKTKLTF